MRGIDLIDKGDFKANVANDPHQSAQKKHAPDGKTSLLESAPRGVPAPGRPRSLPETRSRRKVRTRMNEFRIAGVG